jgi:TRAP-type mannitol/chloroaromatic compound transport system permease small subunit
MITYSWKLYLIIFLLSVVLTRNLILDIPGDLIFSEERQRSKLVILLNGVAHSLVLIGLLVLADYFDIIPSV